MTCTTWKLQQTSTTTNDMTFKMIKS